MAESKGDYCTEGHIGYRGVTLHQKLEDPLLAARSDMPGVAALAAHEGSGRPRSD